MPEPLTITCAEVSRDSLLLEQQNEDQILLNAYSGSDYCTEEIGIYLNRASAELVHTWLGGVAANSVLEARSPTMTFEVTYMLGDGRITDCEMCGGPCIGHATHATPPRRISATAVHHERLELRGCRNCVAFDGARCRSGTPGPHGWPEVNRDDWCLSWRHELHESLTWTSPIVGAEIEEIPCNTDTAIS